MLSFPCVIHHPLDRCALCDDFVSGIVLGSGDTEEETRSLPQVALSPGVG